MPGPEKSTISLRAPGLGPIIGHTTDTTCRVWIRASDPGDTSAGLNPGHRTIGVIGIVTDPDDASKRAIGDAWYFRLAREYDRTGTFRLGFDVPLGRWEDDARRERRIMGRAQRPAEGK